MSYVLKYRTNEGRQRWLTIGKHGSPWTPDTARQKAIQVLGAVVSGQDPAANKTALRRAVTVSEICDLYLADAEAGRLLTRGQVSKKRSTILTDRGRIVRHIKPLLGAMKVASVLRNDIEEFMHSVAAGKTACKAKTEKKRGLAHVKGGKGTASRTVGLLGAIFTYAVKKGIRPTNPVHGVMRFADGKRTRRLTEEEYGLLGVALRTAEQTKIWSASVSAVWFLVLTGWRSGEALNLRWTDVDFERRTAVLSDTKTGRSMRPLSKVVCESLQQLPRISELVFPSSRGGGAMTGFPRILQRIGDLGRVPRDITAHVFRHSYSSLASDLGYSEPTIASMIGHAGQTVTSRYIHTADVVLLAAADVIAEKTVDLLSQSTVISDGHQG